MALRHIGKTLSGFLQLIQIKHFHSPAYVASICLKKPVYFIIYPLLGDKWFHTLEKGIRNKVVYKQSHLGLNIGSPVSFPTMINIMRYVLYLTVLYTHLRYHNDTIIKTDTMIRTQEDFFNEIFTSHFICKDTKGLLKVCM